MSCKYSEYECGSCYYLRDMDYDSRMFNDSSNVKGHCIYLKNCYYPDDKICNHYVNRDSYVPGGGCFITTIVCKMLGFDDKCGILNTLRNFRNNVMQKDEKYKGILYEYDTVGPKIAENLLEENDMELVHGMFNFFIQPTVRLIEENKKEEAITRYMEMTKSLENYYGIKYDGIVSNNYDYTKGGHGVKQKKFC